MTEADFGLAEGHSEAVCRRRQRLKRRWGWVAKTEGAIANDDDLCSAAPPRHVPTHHHRPRATARLYLSPPPPRPSTAKAKPSPCISAPPPTLPVDPQTVADLNVILGTAPSRRASQGVVGPGLGLAGRSDDESFPARQCQLPATTSPPRPPVILRKSNPVPGASGDSHPSRPHEAILVAGVGAVVLDSAWAPDCTVHQN